jgi:mono/diheme cytochrome c family protein
MKKRVLIGMGILILALAACSGGAPAGDQAEAPVVTTDTVDQNIPATDPIELPQATSAPEMTEAPAGQSATQAPAATEPAAGSASGASTTCELTLEEEQALTTTGETFYTATCVACHGAQGEGQGSFPSLAGNVEVTADDPSELIAILKDPQIHPFASAVTDEQVAAVVTYIRGAFGNQAAAVCADQVTTSAQ